MAAISSGVARPAVSSITETRYCMLDHLLSFGAPLVGGRSPLLRRLLSRSDTACGMSFKTRGAPVENDPTRRGHRWTSTPAVGGRRLSQVSAHLDLLITGLR